MGLLRKLLDADEIIDKLWIGSRPPKGSILKLAGFDVLVMCAKEYQPKPPVDYYPGIQKVVYAPFEDNKEKGLSESDLKSAIAATDYVIKYLDENKKVLVTCLAGINRSSLVVALTMKLKGLPSETVINTIRTKRPGTLTNPFFEDFIASL